MISLIVSSYFFPILILVMGSLFILFFGFYCFFKKSKKIVSRKNETFDKNPLHKPSITITSNDITAIAGDDVIATQLDLARAYIETGRKQLAKKILNYVIQQGSIVQQQEAKHLLNFVSEDLT